MRGRLIVHKTDSQTELTKESSQKEEKVLQKFEKRESTQGATVTGAEGRGHIKFSQMHDRYVSNVQIT